jgi:hypothetical protein
MIILALGNVLYFISAAETGINFNLGKFLGNEYFRIEIASPFLFAECSVFQ